MPGQVEGIAETLRELGKVDRSLRREVGKTIRAPAEGMRNKARGKLPAQPLSNWTTGRYAYDQGAAAGGISIKLGGRSRGAGTSFGGLVGGTSSFELVAMVQRNAGGAVYEVAGRRSGGNSPQGRAFIAGLNRHASPSRAMWKAAEEDLPRVEDAVVDAIRQVEIQINARLR